MNTLQRGLLVFASRLLLLCVAVHGLGISPCAWAINVTIDYRYDNVVPTPFFNTQQKKDALQAAADRMSAIVTESLNAVTLPNDAGLDPRISFRHPVTGVSNFQVSPATNSGNDAVVTLAGGAAANEYRGPWSIGADQFIVYVGGRSLGGSTAGEANTGTGTNLIYPGPSNDAFDMGGSHLNRGFRSTGSSGNLPMWGGAIAFDNDGSTNWHFNHTISSSGSTTDFYSIALHEIGHLLGLSTGWNEWASLSSGDQFLGPQTVATYNADNGTSVGSLTRTGDGHFQDAAYDSFIFQNASPNLVGTVGTSTKQDLLMEPLANFTGTVRRFEVTNVDVAALRDVGWSTVPQISIPPVQPGDYNKDGAVNAADYAVWRKGIEGDEVTWRANFGESLPGASPIASTVPEPASWLFLLISVSPVFLSRRPPRKW